MPGAVEATQVGKVESWSQIIDNIETDSCPYSTMLEKRTRPSSQPHSWQVEAYPDDDIKGVPDNKDADRFESMPREQIQAYAMKMWNNPQASDFADETEIHGLKGTKEFAKQVRNSMTRLKRKIEKRLLSNQDNAVDNTIDGYGTRGAFLWVDNSAQGVLPVPAAFRTPAASISTAALGAIDEKDVFLPLMRSAFKQRKGPHDLDGFVGVDLKAVISDFGCYTTDESGRTIVRQMNQDGKSKALTIGVDFLDLDTGKVRLHISSFLYHDINGVETAYTHRSGLFLDMKRMAMAYTRKPRVMQQTNRGGGRRAIIDTIFLHQCDNPLGHAAIKSNADS